MVSAPAKKRVLTTSNSRLRGELVKWNNGIRKKRALNRVARQESQVGNLTKTVLAGMRYSGLTLKTIGRLQQSAEKKFREARTQTEFRFGIIDLRSILAKCKLALTDLKTRKDAAYRLVRHFQDLKIAGRFEGRKAEYQKALEIQKDLRNNEIAIEYIMNHANEALANLERMLEASRD